MRRVIVLTKDELNDLNNGKEITFDAFGEKYSLASEYCSGKENEYIYADGFCASCKDVTSCQYKINIQFSTDPLPIYIPKHSAPSKCKKQYKEYTKALKEGKFND